MWYNRGMHTLTDAQIETMVAALQDIERNVAHKVLEPAVADELRVRLLRTYKILERLVAENTRELRARGYEQKAADCAAGGEYLLGYITRLMAMVRTQDEPVH